MPGILVFSEQDDLALGLLPKALELAQQLNLELGAAILGSDVGNRAAQFLTRGVNTAYAGENELLSKFDGEVYAEALFRVTEVTQPEIILCASTKRGRELASRLARRLEAGCLTNVLDVSIEDGKVVTSRYGLGGATIISECLESARKVIALLPQRYEATQAKASEGQIIKVELKLNEPKVTIVERGERQREAVNIERADVLVCIGKGLKQKEDISLIQELADAVKGEIGCTREIASNRGWLTEDRLVGMSGKRCKPKVVFSIGISGQNQYVAGITGAKVSVAVNTDDHAPILRVADYGLVADLYQVLPKLIEKLKQAKSHAET
ncbi:MAG: electron transfer flavoprotein subunit alpha/FixB family protein [Chloroflexota bacterium]